LYLSTFKLAGIIGDGHAPGFYNLD